MDGDGIDDVVHRELSAAQRLDDIAARRIGEDLEGVKVHYYTYACICIFAARQPGSARCDASARSCRFRTNRQWRPQSRPNRAKRAPESADRRARGYGWSLHQMSTPQVD